MSQDEFGSGLADVAIEPNHPDYEKFGVWHNVASDLASLTAVMAVQLAPVPGCPASRESASMEERNGGGHVGDLVGTAEMVIRNGAEHLHAISELSGRGGAFVPLPVLSLARVSIEAGAKLVYFFEPSIDVSERLSRFFSLHHQETKKNHYLTEEGKSLWPEKSMEIKARAITAGAKVRKVPPIGERLRPIDEALVSVYEVLCGAVHSDASMIRQASTRPIFNDGQRTTLGPDSKPLFLAQNLWFTYVATEKGFTSYAEYLGQDEVVARIVDLKANFVAHAQELHRLGAQGA